VSPVEIEEVAYETGLINDAVALGIDDAALGHRIVLAVTPSDPAAFDPGGIMQRLRQELPRYMVPSEVVAFTVLPRSPNGKFDRGLLRQELGAPRSSSTA
jgi:acyl-CoA synthetase (AMP-forming)/AMP-acid ligase II